MRDFKESIDSGDYFIEARSWYNSVFLAPIKNNAFMLGALLSVVMLLFFVFYSLYNVFPLSEKVRVVVFLENTMDFSPKLKNISDSSKPVKQSVLEYLAGKYIVSRETYDPKTFRRNYYFILRNTDKELFDQYYNTISMKGPTNPAELYKKGHRSKVYVTAKHYSKDNISVNFTKQNYNIKTGEESWQKFTAKLRFVMPDYNFSESKNARLNFIVTGYEVNEVD